MARLRLPTSADRVDGTRHVLCFFVRTVKPSVSVEIECGYGISAQYACCALTKRTVGWQGTLFPVCSVVTPFTMKHE